MKKHSIWLPVLFAMMLGITGCGDDETTGGTGATGGSGATSGSGATGGSNGGEFCSTICNSPCVGDLGMAGEVQECIDGCSAGGIFEGCESETVAFIDCLEANDCGESGGIACANQAIAFAQCFGVM